MRIIREDIPALRITPTARRVVPRLWKCSLENHRFSRSSPNRFIRKNLARPWKCIATHRKQRAPRNQLYSGKGYGHRNVVFFYRIEICSASDRSSIEMTFILNCFAQRDGAPIQRNRSKINGGNLTIESLRRADFGFYHCVASNEVATISTSTQLIVEGTQPHAPYNVTGNATEFAVTLNWLPGYSGGPDYKQDYTIWRVTRSKINEFFLYIDNYVHVIFTVSSNFNVIGTEKLVHQTGKWYLWHHREVLWSRSADWHLLRFMSFRLSAKTLWAMEQWAKSSP